MNLSNTWALEGIGMGGKVTLLETPSKMPRTTFLPLLKLVLTMVTLSVMVSGQVNATDNWSESALKFSYELMSALTLTRALQIDISRKKAFSWVEFGLQICEYILHLQPFHLPIMDLTKEKGRSSVCKKTLTCKIKTSFVIQAYQSNIKPTVFLKTTVI